MNQTNFANEINDFLSQESIQYNEQDIQSIYNDVKPLSFFFYLIKQFKLKYKKNKKLF
jgi:hypothetical protein